LKINIKQSRIIIKHNPIFDLVGVDNMHDLPPTRSESIEFRSDTYNSCRNFN
jgi:hypothetical protein